MEDPNTASNINNTTQLQKSLTEDLLARNENDYSQNPVEASQRVNDPKTTLNKSMSLAGGTEVATNAAFTIRNYGGSTNQRHDLEASEMVRGTGGGPAGQNDGSKRQTGTFERDFEERSEGSSKFNFKAFGGNGRKKSKQMKELMKIKKPDSVYPCKKFDFFRIFKFSIFGHFGQF